MGGVNMNFTSGTTVPNPLFVQTVAGGAPGTIKSNAPGYYYGNDPLNNTVGTSTTFWNAVSLVRGRAYTAGTNSWGAVTSTIGRQYLTPNLANNTGTNVTWIYPPAWAQVDVNMGTTDPSTNTAEMTGNPADTVDRLAQLNIAVLGVEFMPCTNFAFQSTDMNNATYWKERWCAACRRPSRALRLTARRCTFRELYKHTYVVAGWSWKRGMQKIEARCSCLRPLFFA